MINYHVSESSLFTDNRNYSDQIVKHFDVEENATGIVDSWGFDVKTTFSKRDLKYDLHFVKNQSTQGGGSFFYNPIAIDSYSLKIVIMGSNQTNRIRYFKSRLRRLTMKKSLISIVSKPFFLSFNPEPTPEVLSSLLEFLQSESIDSFMIKNGKLKCEIYSVRNDLGKLKSEIERVAENYFLCREQV